MSAKPEIWIVDDDAAVRDAYGGLLHHSGFAVREFEDGAHALAALEHGSPDLVLLDVKMPRLDGWKTLAELRRRGGEIPVLMISHQGDVKSQVRGLEGGADDYISKPCMAEELLARTRALLRRSTRRVPPASSTVTVGEVHIDFGRRTASRGGKPIKLTRTDFALLELLHEHRGKPVPRETILARVWGNHAGTSHALDTHLWRLRRKLGDVGEGPQLIRNAHGMGYVLD